MRARTLLAILLCVLTSLATAQPRNGTFRISGKVVNALTGEPLGNTRLELAPTEGARWAKAALTKKNGEFAFEQLAPGKYQLYAERSGFPRQGFDEHEGGFLSAIVTGEGKVSGNLVFRMQPEAIISGVVIDEYEEAVRGAEVMLFHRAVVNGRSGTYLAGRNQTDDRGIYKFGPLMPGTYYVVVSAHPWYAQNALPVPMRIAAGGSQPKQPVSEELNVVFPVTFYSDTTDAEGATPIRLHTGEAFRADFNLRTIPAARLQIQGSTERQREANIDLIQKIFEDDFPAPTVQQMTSDRSRVITGLAPGRYLVRVQSPGKGLERSQWMDIDGDTTLDVENITSAASASITGLASAEGVKLENAFIQFRNRDTGEVLGDRIAADGKFKIAQIPAGTYEVSVGNSASVYLANMAASNAKASGRTLEIPGGADVRMAIILSKGVGEIKGTAVQGDKGVSGMLVLLVPDDPSNHIALFRRDQSDSDGTFSLRQVVPGRYTLLAIDNGWDLEWTDPKVLQPFLAKGYPLQVESNGKYDVRVEGQRAK